MKTFQVSVVVPVYNAAEYVEEAVQSVVDMPEVGEVLLVDDASTDNSLEVCRQLAARYAKVRSLQHPDGRNMGAAASRNAGIRAATCDYIAFLDADDYYLPNRFTTDKEVFAQHPDADGVYSCNKAIFENEEARTKFLRRYSGELTTVKTALPPEKLFKVLMFGTEGRFHTSAITLHKRAFEKVGLFNTDIRYVEDTELWLKLSLKAILLPGSIHEPVSIRRVHDTNSIHQVHKVEEYSKKMYQALFDWALEQPFDFETKNDFYIALERFTEGASGDARRFFWKQVRRKPLSFLSVFGLKKIHQLYLIR
jgi:glycosyltransferase involved in cell wall biosynthesis